MTETDGREWGHASSTGQGFTHTGIVDAHYAACRETYERCLRRAGIRQGWRVLDAGCGSGSFLPLLAELTGPGGQVSALDLAPEHVALAAPLAHDARQGSVLDMPYADDSVDAVWCANTVQYLTDSELDRALSEMRRVVRPGGLVAVKELDVELITVRPGDRFQLAGLFRAAAAAAPGYARQLLRAPDLYRRLAAAGLTGVRQETHLIEHFAPLAPAARAFYQPACAELAAQATSLGLDGDWERFADPKAPDNPLTHPHGYITEGAVLATGIVPGAGAGNPSGSTCDIRRS